MYSIQLALQKTYFLSVDFFSIAPPLARSPGVFLPTQTFLRGSSNEILGRRFFFRPLFVRRSRPLVTMSRTMFRLVAFLGVCLFFWWASPFEGSFAALAHPRRGFASERLFRPGRLAPVVGCASGFVPFGELQQAVPLPRCATAAAAHAFGAQVDGALIIHAAAVLADFACFPASMFAGDSKAAARFVPSNIAICLGLGEGGLEFFCVVTGCCVPPAQPCPAHSVALGTLIFADAACILSEAAVCLVPPGFATSCFSG